MMSVLMSGYSISSEREQSLHHCARKNEDVGEGLELPSSDMVMKLS